MLILTVGDNMPAMGWYALRHKQFFLLAIDHLAAGKDAAQAAAAMEAILGVTKETELKALRTAVNLIARSVRYPRREWLTFWHDGHDRHNTVIKQLDDKTLGVWCRHVPSTRDQPDGH